MKTKINHPAQSKINWLAALLGFIGLASALGWIPEDAAEHIIEIAVVVVPPLIIVARTWFTEPKE